jgi:hypothetical protein
MNPVQSISLQVLQSGDSYYAVLEAQTPVGAYAALRAANFEVRTLNFELRPGQLRPEGHAEGRPLLDKRRGWGYGEPIDVRVLPGAPAFAKTVASLADPPGVQMAAGRRAPTAKNLTRTRPATKPPMWAMKATPPPA